MLLVSFLYLRRTPKADIETEDPDWQKVRKETRVSPVYTVLGISIGATRSESQC